MECKKNTLNFYFPNDSKKPIPAKSTLPRPTANKENAPCGGLTFFCLLFLCQDKKRRKKHKKNVPNFPIPKELEKPIPTKSALPRLPTNKGNAPFSSVRVGAYRIRPHSFLEK